MGHWRFNSVAHMGEPFVTERDYLLVAASVLIATLTASVFTPSIERFRSSKSLRSHALWALTGALAMAMGIWGMHFTNLLALQLPVPISYKPILTAVSVLPVMAGAILTLAVCKAPIHPPVRVRIAAASMAAGYMLMHFISMEAIVAPLRVHYNVWLFIASTLAALVLFWGGMYSNVLLVIKHRNHWAARLAGSVLLGCAVSAVPYFALQATLFYPDPSIDPPMHEIDARGLSLGISMVVSMLVGLLLMAVVVDRRISRISRSLNDSESRFRILAETSACAIFTFEETFTYANAALTSITGFSEEELQKMPVETLFGPALIDRLDKAKESPGTAPALNIAQEVEIERQDGTSRWLYITIGSAYHDAQVCYIGSAFDITEHKHMEQRLSHLAYFDSLTELANRVYFLEHVQKRLHDRGAESEDDQCALLAVNLSRLKWINDSFGQAAGDKLLCDLSQELRMLLMPGDFIARVGGHEFGILLASTASIDDAKDMAEAILQRFAQPHSISEQEIQLRCQVGIALASAATTEADDLLRQAYIAMNRARSQNSSHFCLFDQAMRESAQQRLHLESDLNRALAEKQFELYYQPIVSLPEGADIFGCEALIRWPRTDGTFTSPVDFIPLAEETGLIAPLGDWILKAACRQLAYWNHTLGIPAYVSVNISSLQLFQPNFVQKLGKLMDEHQILPGRLKLEMTESVLVEDGPGVLRTMHELLALGCEIMIDDFGTGYSSLSYLARFPASVIKIDKSFIQGIGAEDVGAPIIKAIVSMARDLGLTVIAEGIENEDAAHFLNRIGCKNAQGFLFSRPLPSHEVTALLEAHQAASENSR